MGYDYVVDRGHCIPSHPLEYRLRRVEATEVSDFFEFDLEKGEFIFCAIKLEDEEGNILSLPREIDLKKAMKNIPDTTDSIFSANRYKEYTMDELIEISSQQ